MKKIGDNRLKCAVCESTLSTAARSPFPNGEGYETRIPLFSHCQNKYTHMWKKNNDGQSLPRVGKVASGASRIGFWRYEKERRRSSQVRHYTRAPERRRKRKPTPPRCARQPLPREGARVDTPSFLWKEVSRRGGGWMEGSGMKKRGGIVSGRRFTKASSTRNNL